MPHTVACFCGHVFTADTYAHCPRCRAAVPHHGPRATAVPAPVALADLFARGPFARTTRR